VLHLDVEMLKRTPGYFARFDLTAEVPPFELRGENVIFTDPVKACLVANNTGSAIVVEGEVSGRLKLTCSRCLEVFNYAFEVPVNETYTHMPESVGGDVVPFSGNVIDITPEVVRSIILSLPMKAVCSEDCRGLCPRCGCDLNKDRCNCENEDIDPRLSVFEGLLEKFNH